MSSEPAQEKPQTQGSSNVLATLKPGRKPFRTFVNFFRRKKSHPIIHAENSHLIRSYKSTTSIKFLKEITEEDINEDELFKKPLALKVILPPGIENNDLAVSIQVVTKASLKKKFKRKSKSKSMVLTCKNSSQNATTYYGQLEVPSNTSLQTIVEMPLYFADIAGAPFKGSSNDYTVFKPVVNTLAAEIDQTTPIADLQLTMTLEKLNPAVRKFSLPTTLQCTFVKIDDIEDEVQHVELSRLDEIIVCEKKKCAFKEDLEQPVLEQLNKLDASVIVREILCNVVDDMPLSDTSSSTRPAETTACEARMPMEACCYIIEQTMPIDLVVYDNKKQTSPVAVKNFTEHEWQQCDDPVKLDDTLQLLRSARSRLSQCLDTKVDDDYMQLISNVKSNIQSLGIMNFPRVCLLPAQVNANIGLYNAPDGTETKQPKNPTSPENTVIVHAVTNIGYSDNAEAVVQLFETTSLETIEIIDVSENQSNYLDDLIEVSAVDTCRTNRFDFSIDFDMSRYSDKSLREAGGNAICFEHCASTNIEEDIRNVIEELMEETNNIKLMGIENCGRRTQSGFNIDELLDTLENPSNLNIHREHAAEEEAQDANVHSYHVNYCLLDDSAQVSTTTTHDILGDKEISGRSSDINGINDSKSVKSFIKEVFESQYSKCDQMLDTKCLSVKVANEQVNVATTEREAIAKSSTENLLTTSPAMILNQEFNIAVDRIVMTCMVQCSEGSDPDTATLNDAPTTQEGAQISTSCGNESAKIATPPLAHSASVNIKVLKLPVPLLSMSESGGLLDYTTQPISHTDSEIRLDNKPLKLGARSEPESSTSTGVRYSFHSMSEKDSYDSKSETSLESTAKGHEIVLGLINLEYKIHSKEELNTSEEIVEIENNVKQNDILQAYTESLYSIPQASDSFDLNSDGSNSTLSGSLDGAET